MKYILKNILLWYKVKPNTRVYENTSIREYTRMTDDGGGGRITRLKAKKTLSKQIATQNKTSKISSYKEEIASLRQTINEQKAIIRQSEERVNILHDYLFRYTTENFKLKDQLVMLNAKRVDDLDRI